MSKNDVNIHKMPPKGFRQQKRLTRVERLEQAVKRLSSLPQFLLQRFQDLTKVVQDLRFTYEVLGRILQEKGIISQEEVTDMGNKLIEQQRKENEKKLKLMKEEADQKKDREKLDSEIEGEVVETLSSDEVKKELHSKEDNLREDMAKELMKPRKDLQEKQIQNVDVSIKDTELNNI